MEQYPLGHTNVVSLWAGYDAVVLIWVVVKIMVPFWVPILIRHLIFRVPNKGTISVTTTDMKMTWKYVLLPLGTVVTGDPCQV